MIKVVEHPKELNCFKKYFVSQKKLIFLLVVGVIILSIAAWQLKLVKNDDIDFFIFSQRWLVTACISYEEKGANRQCKLPSQLPFWAIHGLWPQKGKTKGPFFCNTSWPFDVRELDTIVSDMRMQWPDIEHPSSTTFWRHEWDKHGTCAATISLMNTQLKYFSRTLDLFRQHNMNSYFQNIKLEPSANAIFVRDLLFKLKRVLGRNCFIHCYKTVRTHEYYINEVRLCLSTDLNLIDCNTLREDKKNFENHSLNSATNCPLDAPVYYPINFNLSAQTEEYKIF